jgi:hypothetical protein
MVQSTHLPMDHAATGYAAARAQSADYGMTGERNEDSVLFSARNIRQSIAPPPGSARAGYASGEGSGLIDIRSLAALAHTHPQSSPPVARSIRPVVPMESTMALPTRSFGGLDTLAPVERAQRRSKALPIAILSGSAMIAAAAFAAVYITRGMPEAELAVPAPAVTVAPIAAAAIAAPSPAPALPSPAVEPAEPPAAAAADPATTEKPSEDLLAAVAAKEPEANEEPEEAAPVKASAPTRSSKTRKRGSARAEKRAEKRVEAESALAEKRAEKAERAEKAAKEEAAAATKSAKAAKPAKAEEEAAADEGEDLDDLLLADKQAKGSDKAKSSSPAGDDDPLLGAMDAPPAKEPPKNRSIDELLDGAVVAAKKGTSSAPKDSLPETPSRDQVKAAMRGVESDVRACAEGQTLESPTATVAITVSGSTGRVTGARVTGSAGSIAGCVARAVRGATFPKFSKSEFSINFPFKLK